jgi:hypothetical protein
LKFISGTLKVRALTITYSINLSYPGCIVITRWHGLGIVTEIVEKVLVNMGDERGINKGVRK